MLSAISLRTPRNKKSYADAIEIARYASAKNVSVMGGFSKLLKASITWAKENGYDRIITYSDIRLGQTNVYEKAGFNQLSKTKLNYWYSDGIKRHDRFKFRAQSGKMPAWP